MSIQRLDRTLTAYRIGDPDGDHPIFDATGSRLYPGRWNDSDTQVIYASEHYSTAMLEKLVHGSGLMPPNQHYIEITLPRNVSYEMVTKDSLPGWDDANAGVARRFGSQWVREERTLLLLVPSYVARVERNIVINPAHSEFPQIEQSLPAPIWWDKRLFAP
ncbi:MAG TPA: RES domain-containing protein [Gammaproteobacteria bacterium]|nr:RES domain-containing protein [Gammaproteobacteria bacterium]